MLTLVFTCKLKYALDSSLPGIVVWLFFGICENKNKNKNIYLPQIGHWEQIEDSRNKST